MASITARPATSKVQMAVIILCVGLILGFGIGKPFLGKIKGIIKESKAVNAQTAELQAKIDNAKVVQENMQEYLMLLWGYSEKMPAKGNDPVYFEDFQELADLVGVQVTSIDIQAQLSLNELKEAPATTEDEVAAQSEGGETTDGKSGDSSGDGDGSGDSSSGEDQVFQGQDVTVKGIQATFSASNLDQVFALVNGLYDLRRMIVMEKLTIDKETTAGGGEGKISLTVSSFVWPGSEALPPTVALTPKMKKKLFEKFKDDERYKEVFAEAEIDPSAEDGGNVSEGDVSEGDVPEEDVTEGDVTDGPKGD